MNSASAPHGDGTTFLWKTSSAVTLCHYPDLRTDEVKASREHAAFEQTQEEPGREQTAVTRHDPLHDRGEAEQAHHGRQPHPGLETFQQNATGYT